MFNHLCLNGTTMEQHKFSKPSPLNGLYIAGVTLVCLVCMLSDVFVGFFRRKRWFPCRFFSLTSLTLTLVTVATRVILDRTTINQTAHYQLSKLTGTSMIYISMGFFLPSLGTMRSSECFANMASLSILVITIIYSISLQISTGLILPVFIANHAVIMFLMFVLLVVLWFSAIGIIQEKKYSSDHHDKLLTSTSGSLRNRLKYCYVYSYVFNPQLRICRTPNVISVAIVCFISSLVLLEAVFRSLFLSGALYGIDPTVDLSMSIVVGTQVIFILLGGLATYYRVLISLYHLNVIPSLKHLKIEVDHLKLQFIFYRGNVFQILQRIGTILVLVGHVCANYVLAVPSYIVTSLFDFMRKILVDAGAVKVVDITELKKVFDTYIILADDWILRRGQADFDRWIEVNEKNTLKHLADFLSGNCSGDCEDSGARSIRELGRTDYKVSCLSMAMLAMYAEFTSLDGSIVRTLDEAFKLIYFIDKNTTESKRENKRKRKFTKEVWLGGKFTRRSKCCDNWANPEKSKNPPLPRELKTSPSFQFVSEEIKVIEHLKKSNVNQKTVLADMIREFLAKLPTAIYNDVIQSRPEDYERKVKRAIKFICKLEFLVNAMAVKEVDIVWKFPDGVNMHSLI